MCGANVDSKNGHIDQNFTNLKWLPSAMLKIVSGDISATYCPISVRNLLRRSRVTHIHWSHVKNNKFRKFKMGWPSFWKWFYLNRCWVIIATYNAAVTAQCVHADRYCHQLISLYWTGSNTENKPELQFLLLRVSAILIRDFCLSLGCESCRPSREFESKMSPPSVWMQWIFLFKIFLPFAFGLVSEFMT